MRARHLLVLLAAAAACDGTGESAHLGSGGAAGASTGAGGDGGSGGQTAAGGSPGSGGSSSAGGATASGGVAPTGGGMAGAGGATASGGVAATGGGPGAGGTNLATRDAGAGGSKPDGGNGGSSAPGGGVTGAGGMTGGGGMTGAAGATATGGSTGSGGARADAASDGRGEVGPDTVRDAGPDGPATGGSDAVTSDGSPCPHNGHVTYTLTRSANPTTAEQQAYDLIVPAMDKAVYYYNCYTDITKALNVSYSSSVQTADGNYNGSIRFGGTQYMEYVTAMHEIAHTVGVGTASNWRSFVAFPDGGSSGPWTGANATTELRAITGSATDTLTADTQHFWPYGLNYASEWHSEADGIAHCRIVVALRKDMGL
jgi:hypothetical protein